MCQIVVSITGEDLVPSVPREHHHRLGQSVNRLVMGILTASLVLGSSLLWALKAPPALYDNYSVPGLFCARSDAAHRLC